ncbi:pre-mrna polyadenylation factor fip1 [Moniliophthora roreri]|nr:pre-mrna polyadenylation factor fip1 [Moniliophthora roreri]
MKSSHGHQPNASSVITALNAHFLFERHVHARAGGLDAKNISSLIVDVWGNNGLDIGIEWSGYAAIVNSGKQAKSMKISRPFAVLCQIVKDF